MAFASILPSRPRASIPRSIFLLAAMALAATAEPAFAAASTLPHNLSAWGMFMAADRVVKSVMIGLALASVATWTVLVALHRTAFTQIDDARGLGDATRAVSTDAIAAAAFLSAARVEIQQSDGALEDVDNLKERIVSRLDRTEAAAVRRM
jgi:biopolymer transport protein ExbB